MRAWSTEGLESMVSMRAWLVSGTFVAGMSAGMLWGAGVATADTGGDPGGSTSVSAAATESPATKGGARRAPALRPPGARPTATLRESASRVARAAAAVQPAAAVRAARAPKEDPIAIPAVSPSPVAAPARVAAGRANPVPRPAAQPVPVVPSSAPVDPADFAGTYYEQGSVKQFFSIGLVNTSATYSLNPDGTIRVQNSGNYFFNRGLRSSIVGSAVAVNDTNTALNVGFSPFGPPSADPPGNYTILAKAPDYSWVIVSDPSGQSGYILTRDKNIPADQYRQLVDQARALGVRGLITPTVQYPL